MQPMRIQVLTPDQSPAWMQVLEKSTHYDFYHLPQYHALAEASGEGTARLFHYKEGRYSIALPLLVRSLDAVPGLTGDRAGLGDATSVYGYAGPIASHAECPEEVVRGFQAELEGRLRDLGVIAVFARLHPLLQQQELLRGLGECQTLGRTVSIDLTLPIDMQRAAFRKNHKEGINRLRRIGVTCVRDDDGSHVEDFLGIYHETMRRVGAKPAYFFTRDHFTRLMAALGERLNLFVCLKDGIAIGAGILIECNGILQYHLGGTATSALRFAPMKLLIDQTRQWGTARGLRVYHLGGGATARPDDPLLHFKTGFSDRTHDFAVWRWLLRPDAYFRLCEEKARWNAGHGLEIANAEFFPKYRAPTTLPALPAPHFAEVGPVRNVDSVPQGRTS
jgi:hypothetical protein